MGLEVRQGRGGMGWVAVWSWVGLDVKEREEGRIGGFGGEWA